MRRLVLVGTLATAACVPATATVEAPVRRLVDQRAGLELDADATALLDAPLTQASAARLAAVHHPRAAAALAELGLAAGELGLRRGLGHTDLDVEARLIGREPSFDVAVVQDLMELLTVAPRRAAGDAMVAAAQARASATLLELAARAELAWLDVAAATEQLALARDAFDTLAASADLTERIRAAGGTTALAQARAQTARELARLDVAQAETALELARTSLDGALGLSGAATQWQLGAALPADAGPAPSVDDLETAAVAASLELAALDADQRALRNDARAASVARWLPGLGVGVAAEHSEAGWTAGPALRIGLPLVTGGGGAVVRARAAVSVSEHRLTATAVELRAAARAARVELLGARAAVIHLATVVVPLARQVVADSVLQYNAMNVSPFELLTARRDQAMAEQALVAARLRLARAEVVVRALRHGVVVASPSSSSSAATSSRAASAHGGHP
ncbi:MAG: TolC family protein [Kofleriaceae bacterium]